MSLSVATNFLADRCASARRFERNIEAEQKTPKASNAPPGAPDTGRSNSVAATPPTVTLEAPAAARVSLLGIVRSAAAAVVASLATSGL